MRHPLLDVLEDAAAGRHPPVDGGVTFLPPVANGNRAIVALTGHAVVCTDQPPEVFADLALDGFGAALSPAAQLRLADGGRIGVNDVTLVAPGLGGAEAAPAAGVTSGAGAAAGIEDGGAIDLPPTGAWDDHHRVRHARALRSDVRVHGDHRGFVAIAAGLAGRQELSIELSDPGFEAGLGRRFVTWARTRIEPGSWLFAAVSPGNARSLRSFLAAGFAPIGSEVIIDRSDLS